MAYRIKFGDDYPLSMSVTADTFQETRAVFNALAAYHLIVVASKPDGEVLSFYDNTKDMGYRFTEN